MPKAEKGKEVHSRKGKSATPKPPKIELSAEDKIKRNYKSLHDQLDGGFYANAIKTCDRILRLAPADNLAIKTKLQLLIASDQFLPALALLKEKEGNGEDYTAEKIYSLYKSGRVVEAGAVLDELDEGVLAEDRALQVLEAQVRYRLEDYARTRDIYDELLVTAELDSPEVPDLQTNLNAASARLDFISNVPSTLASSSIPPLEKLEITPVAPLIHSHPLYKTAVSTAAAASKASKAKAASQQQPIVDKKGKALDPDRWLPKRERPGFAEEIVRKREQERGKKKQALMTQGSAASEPATPAKSSGSGGGGGGASAKKKKGKK